MDRRSFGSLIVVLAALTSSCRDAPLASNVRSNMPPVARAGEMQVLEFDGSPVTVTLDGSESNDADGEVEEYRWFSGTAADGGERSEPDPDDVEKPTVTLGAGVWRFVLYVVDNDGGISTPSSVTIQVGNAASPEATECSAGSLDTISEECRLCVCGVSDACRMAITACDQPCWDFYGCVQNQCSEFVGGDAMTLSDCVRTNCSTFFAGVGKYMPLDPCVNGEMCSATCGESVRM